MSSFACDEWGLLSQKQCSYIEELQKNGNPVLVKSFLWEGQKKSLVILGEFHVKDKINSQLEMNLINSFRVRFLESGGPSGAKNIPMVEKFFLHAVSLQAKSSSKKVLEKEVERSSIFKSSMRGVYFSIYGSIFYNGCKIGVINRSSLFFNSNLDSILKQLNENEKYDLFKRLSYWAVHVGDIYENAANQDQYFVWNDNRSGKVPECSVEKIDFTNEYVNIGIERGNVSHWKNFGLNSLSIYHYDFFKEVSTEKWFQESSEFSQAVSKIARQKKMLEISNLPNLLQNAMVKVAWKILTTFEVPREKVPGFRELFMVDNVASSLQFIEEPVIVVVGAAHLGFFNEAFGVESLDKGNYVPKWLEIYRQHHL